MAQLLAYHRPPKHPRALRLLAAFDQRAEAAVRVQSDDEAPSSPATLCPHCLHHLRHLRAHALPPPLYWDPQPLVFNGITCPTCAAPLANRGSIRSGPLTIHDVAGPFFFTGYAYACTVNPAHIYTSTDSAVQRTLSAVLECEFPIHLLVGDTGVGPDMWNGGVSRVLWSLVLGVLRAGLGRSVILQLVRGVQPSCLEFYYRFCTEPSAYSVPSFDAAEPCNDLTIPHKHLFVEHNTHRYFCSILHLYLFVMGCL
ncbi:hypothetical protein B0H14DRAFT_3523060 [Mycena olivaceomarginata]|nr:hypothetical protein B0H14DRAFT_3523060 [Mycena olivaceomarginata]